MSIFSQLFPSKADAPAPAPIQAPAPTAPATTQATAPATPDTPLDPYKDLWQNDPNAAPAPTGMDFNVTPQQLAKIAGKIDFASVVPAALHERIAAGGEDAVKASMEMQNLIARAVYSQNAMATTKLVEAATQKAQEGIESIIDKRLKLMGVAENTAALNPALSNPAVAPLVDVIQQRFIQKFPNATSKEINSKVNEYFSQVGAAFNPEMASRANAPASTAQNMQSLNTETDWAAFLS